ncbi:MAG TPA: hypothetical protein VMM35_05640 [Longimicrobiales bacterium]|nr:hypothetical protein [Longimicrobiales bacterium]
METRTPPLRTETVSARLTPADRALVEAAAAEMQLTRSSAVRQMLLEAARLRLLPEE